jgi:hypothetical protein
MARTWWFMPVIPANQKVEVRGSPREASLDKSTSPYLKNKLKVKGPGA